MNGSWYLVSPKFEKCKEDNSCVQITVSQMGKIECLLLNCELSEGVINAAFSGEKPSLPNKDSTICFILNRKIYHIKSRTRNYSELIFLSHNGNSKYLFFSSRDSDTHSCLYWIGDIDRDEKMDIILDGSNHYNVFHMQLYLSRYANSGEMVKFVAERIVTGD